MVASVVATWCRAGVEGGMGMGIGSDGTNGTADGNNYGATGMKAEMTDT